MQVTIHSNLKLRLWHILLFLIVFGAIIGRLILGDAMLGNSIAPTGAVAKAPQELPAEFKVRHVAISLITHRFNVETSDNPNLGRIDETFFSWGRKFYIIDSAGNLIISMHRPTLNWVTDEWAITVHAKGLDPRLAEVIVASKSAADADK